MLATCPFTSRTCGRLWTLAAPHVGVELLTSSCPDLTVKAQCYTGILWYLSFDISILPKLAPGPGGCTDWDSISQQIDLEPSWGGVGELETGTPNSSESSHKLIVAPRSLDGAIVSRSRDPNLELGWTWQFSISQLSSPGPKRLAETLSLMTTMKSCTNRVQLSPVAQHVQSQPPPESKPDQRVPAPEICQIINSSSSVQLLTAKLIIIIISSSSIIIKL